jgi:hypothetical protein
MRNIFLTIVLVILSYSNIQSQTNFGNEWVTGFGYKLNFNTIPTSHDTFFLNNGTTYFGAGAACVSDSSGHIIIECDGMDLLDKFGQPIQNGDTLVPNVYYVNKQGWSGVPQTSIIIPMENKRYYVFTPTVSDAYYQNVWLNKPALNWNFDLLLYHVVDMNANGGFGIVIEKKKSLLQNTPMKKSQMTACRHANGKDWWLMKMAGDTNKIFTFLVKQDTIIRYPDQYIPFTFLGANEILGQMKFSKDGTKWATTCAWVDDVTYAASGDIYVANFDRCTGLLSSFQRHIAPPYMSDTSNAGLEFSPNGQFLYVSKYAGIQQLEISAGTWYNVTGPDTNVFCGYTTLELAPDNKIYIGRFHGTCKQLSVINNPDVKINCNFCPNCLRSKSNWGYFSTPPNMPNYELGALTQPCWPLMNEEVAGNNTSWEVYPNPAQGVVYIKHKDGKTKRLYNTLGQLLGETQSTMFDVSRLSKGIYFVQCEGEMKKVVVE